jgi:hypothetical protein
MKQKHIDLRCPKCGSTAILTQGARQEGRFTSCMCCGEGNWRRSHFYLKPNRLYPTHIHSQKCERGEDGYKGWHQELNEKKCRLCGRKGFPVDYYPNIWDTNKKLEVYLCQYHKAGYNRRGLKALDKLLRETEEKQ